MQSLEVTFTPADFAAFAQRDLSSTVCVVFDVLRATSSMLTALANGAEAIIPVAEIPEALEVKQRQPAVLLAGERDGVRIRAEQTGSIDFDFGNSPREFTTDKVRGATIVWSTTNGTRALRACSRAQRVFIGSFLNLRALAKWIEANRPSNLLLVCAGTHEEAAYEDTLAAGALTELLWPMFQTGRIADSTQVARQVYALCNGDLMAAMQFSRNARRLLSMPALRDDVAFCLRRDILPFVAELKGNSIFQGARF